MLRAVSNTYAKKEGYLVAMVSRLVTRYEMNLSVVIVVVFVLQWLWEDGHLTSTVESGLGELYSLDV